MATLHKGDNDIIIIIIIIVNEMTSLHFKRRVLISMEALK